MTRKSELIGADNLARVLLDAMPIPVFLVDQNVRILDCNSVAEDILNGGKQGDDNNRCGDFLQCLQEMTTGKPCAHAADCTPCFVGQIIQAALSGNKIVRQKVLLQKGLPFKESSLYLSATPLFVQNEPLVLLAIEDLGQQSNIRHLIPICSCCRRIRGEDHAWHGFEGYLARYHHLHFTHDLCPECLKTSLAEAVK